MLPPHSQAISHASTAQEVYAAAARGSRFWFWMRTVPGAGSVVSGSWPVAPSRSKEPFGHSSTLQAVNSESLSRNLITRKMLCFKSLIHQYAPVALEPEEGLVRAEHNHRPESRR
jgi:hypothetical protein